MKHWSELPNVKKSFEQSLFEQSEYPQEGSSYWRITEIFREKLEADSAGKVFNDQYAHGLSLSLASELNKQRRLVLYGFIAFIILVLSITGNNLPLSFPYIGDLSANQQIPRGLYEVTFYAFLLVTGLLYKSRIRSSTYEKLLRVYADFRHGANNRDLYLLRWNIDDVTPHIVSKEYDDKNSRFSNHCTACSSCPGYCDYCSKTNPRLA